MDFHITIDISDRFEAALAGIAEALKAHAPAPSVSVTPEPAPEPKSPVMPTAIEVAEPVVIETPESTSPDASVKTPELQPEPSSQPAPVDKPKKKKASKKPVEAPEPAPEPEAVVTQPTPEPAATAPTVAQETAKSDGDPMSGMTVVDAVQALVNEIRDKDIDMATVNARVRAKANEIGLTYASAACLIKAIGYVEARRVALGEK